MGDLIDFELAKARRDQEAQELAELEQLAREEGVTLRELVRRLARAAVDRSQKPPADEEERGAQGQQTEPDP